MFFFEGIGRVPLTRYNVCPRIRRTLRKNAAVGIIITVIVSLIVLALGTYMNYLIAIRSQNTENAISFMYVNEKKSLPNNYYLSTTKLYSGDSLGNSGILTSEDRDERVENNSKIFAVLSFILLVIISLISIIRSCLCASELRSHSFKKKKDGQKQGVAVRTLMYVPVATNTSTCAEPSLHICLVCENTLKKI